MFGTQPRGILAYSNVRVETGVEAASPHKLILMLYDGVLLALSDAKMHMAAHAIAPKCQALSKSIRIIEEGLKLSLDMKAGDGELPERLAALYDYMCDRLLSANLHNRPELIDEVSRLLTELREAWAQIAPQTAIANPAGAQAPTGSTYEKA